MMIVPITAVFASVTALLMLFLAYKVSTFRLKHRQGIGVNPDDPDFEVAVRAHANLVEYAPITLIVMGLGELNGVSIQVVYWVGMVFVAGRLLHAYGMFNGHGGPHKARLVGILMTWLSMLVMSVFTVWNVVQVYG